MNSCLRAAASVVLLLLLWPGSLATRSLADASALPPEPVTAQAPDEPRFRQGELLVRFHERARAQAASLHANVSAIPVARLGGGVERVRLAAGQDVEGMRRWYEKQPGVIYAEPNYLARKAVVPDDPGFALQWALRNTGQNVNGITGTPGADIAATDAWARHTGRAEVVVALVDTGIDHTHPDLAANIWRNPGEVAGDGIDNDDNGKVDDVWGWNFVAGHGDPMDDDNDGGHGTHVAGIIGAIGNNGVGVAGINWRVSLMALKVLAANGYGDTAAIVGAIHYAVDHGVHVINISIAYRCGEPASQSERDALERARAAGTLVVVAAGNAGCDNDATPTYPASYPFDNLLAVGASDPFDRRALFPRGGASSYGAQRVHLFAPGRNIYSTLIANRGGYGFESGTSMAAPHVSGAAALLKAHRPELSMAQIRELLLLSAKRLPELGGLAVTSGRLDLGAAMDYDLSASRPIQPSHLTAVPIGDSRVDLTWLGDSTIADGWKVERRRDPQEPFAVIATLGTETLGHRDEATLSGEGTYNGYRVRAFNAVGDSEPGNEVRIKIPPLAPADLQALGLGPRVTLTWRDRSARETGYRVERASDGGLFSEIAQLPADTTRYEDGTVQTGTEYRYRVRAHSAVAGFSNYSSAVVITPRADEGGTQIGCFIATAAYGSALHPRVEVLRRLRDRHLLPHPAGRAFVTAYYRLSPPIAAVIARHDGLRAAVRTLLWPLVWLAEALVSDGHAGALLKPSARGADVDARQTETTPVARQLLVRFDSATAPEVARQVLTARGAIRIETVATSLYLAEFADESSARQAMAQLIQDSRIRYVEPNRLASRPRAD